MFLRDLLELKQLYLQALLFIKSLKIINLLNQLKIYFLTNKSLISVIETVGVAPTLEVTSAATAHAFKNFLRFSFI